MLAYILPTSCYCKLTEGSFKSKKKLPYVLCIIFGFIVMIISTFLSIYNFVKNNDNTTTTTNNNNDNS